MKLLANVNFVIFHKKEFLEKLHNIDDKFCVTFVLL